MIIIIYVILVYAKNILLSHPTSGFPIKYERFHQKLLQLVEYRRYIINSIIKTHDNVDLDVIYVKNPDTTKCIIFFHGNAGNLSMRFDMIKFLYNYASVVVFDYPSYGNSSGDSSNLSAYTLQKDAEAVWNYCRYTLKIPASCISLFGESLGRAIAVTLASNLSKTMDPNSYPHSLILNSPFFYFPLSSMIEIVFSRFNIGLEAN